MLTSYHNSENSIYL